MTTLFETEIYCFLEELEFFPNILKNTIIELDSSIGRCFVKVKSKDNKYIADIKPKFKLFDTLEFTYKLHPIYKILFDDIVKPQLKPNYKVNINFIILIYQII